MAELSLEGFPGHLVGAHPGAHTLRQNVVPAQLVDDRPLDPRRGIRCELKAGSGVESLNGVYEAELTERAKLTDRLERAQPRGKTARHELYQGCVKKNQAIAVLNGPAVEVGRPQVGGDCPIGPIRLQGGRPRVLTLHYHNDDTPS